MSSLRERRAQLTRQAILDAARQLFAERGYARTTVRDIAEAAGVSAQTVYDSIGSKQAVVAQLNDLLDAEAGIRDIAAAAEGATDPAAIAATSAQITRSILEHCSDILHALVTGAASEPELHAVLQEGERRHLGGARFVVGLLERRNALDPALAVDDAAELLAAVTDFRIALVLRDSYGWSLDRIEAHLADASRSLLLAPAAR
jgi:AcrR family transcriptional regulator